MSLPSGYKRLEYIESTGRQYIDTGFKPNQNTRVVMECDLTGGASYPTPFGTWDTSNRNQYILLSFDSNTTYYYQGATQNKPSITILGKHILDSNGQSLYVDGILVTTITAATFQCSYPLYLFTMNDVGAPRSMNMANMVVCSCQIYDNGTLVRDYIPVRRVDGTVGLLDQVNFVFYPDAAGVGFVAGPVIPDVPGNFRQTSQGYFEIGLAWDASEGATGYNLYKDGALIYTGTDLSYLDTQGYPGTSYIYQVTAFSAEGEGDPATLEASTKAGWAVVEPVFLAASISPNPVDINQSILISVQLTDAVRILEAETFYSGELYAGEV